MQRHENGTYDRSEQDARVFARVAVVSLLLGVVFGVAVCWRATWAEFRWVAPAGAAAVNVFLVAWGAWLGARAPVRHEDRAKATRFSPWRRRYAFVRIVPASVRAIRPWPWAVLVGSALSLALCVSTFPVFERRAHATTPIASHSVAIACGVMLALAFVTLVTERFFAARAGESRAPRVLTAALRAALAVFLGAAACAALYAWAGVDARWLAFIVAILPAAIAAEHALRSVLAWFAPPATLRTPLQLVDSALAQCLMQRPASPAEMGAALRHRYGIDLRQSWVVHSTLKMLPAACATLVACAWLLTGVTILRPDQRAVYERFGAPVAVWQPGLHVGLPWPFGARRLLDNGAVRQIVISGTTDEARGDASPSIPADARAPEQLNRLWDVAHQWETTQVIAGGTGRQQNFETVSADVRLDYRVGPGDADARAALYRTSDMAAMLRAIASREVVRYLSSHTLDALVEARQTVIAERLRGAIQQRLDTLGSGIEVVAVVIESVHPPAGASAAWHGVQAAQIRAKASVAEARGLAAGVLGDAAQTAHATVAAASAAAAETLGAANVQQTTFAADVAAAQAGGGAFAFEYYLRNLARGLQNANLTVIDDRLVAGNRATIDLRAYNAGDAAGAKRLY
ncbi:SPFH domain-containing protein [Paraburkholderia sp. J76]|uniref:SPFH domain-containing protein n=1 Tax=Paraburkholderia sp. J76 TaxID=2805439 RepID=UPI002ABD8181|nr:SPFH domain-containing protein [Paraburkholderia sp. J76]